MFLSTDKMTTPLSTSNSSWSKNITIENIENSEMCTNACHNNMTKVASNYALCFLNSNFLIA